MRQESQTTSAHRGDERAKSLELLYRVHAGRLRRRLRSQIGSSDEAKDLVQEAFTRMLGAPGGAEVRNPAAFLNRIVRNLLIDRKRRASARPPHLPLESEADAAVAPGQSEALEYEEMKERYRAAVETLPPRMRQVFIFHRIDGLGYREIAARLDISIRTVEWHVAEAIVRIAKGLDV